MLRTSTVELCEQKPDWRVIETSSLDHPFKRSGSQEQTGERGELEEESGVGGQLCSFVVVLMSFISNGEYSFCPKERTKKEVKVKGKGKSPSSIHLIISQTLSISSYQTLCQALQMSW